MPRVSEERFRALVLAAIDGLPGWAHDALECVEFDVDDEPPKGEPSETMGLYVGVPLPSRERKEPRDPPDRITLFAGPIERETDAKREDLAVTVARVVRHEVAHYFGIDDEELLDLGAY